MNQNEFQSAEQPSKGFDRSGRLASNNYPDEKEKKDHGPNLPEKDLEVKRPVTPNVDPTQKQNIETEQNYEGEL